MSVAATIDSAAARKAMIDSQLRVSGVNDDWVLSAMGSVPREDFVPAAQRGHAYIDRALPLDDGHMLPAPLVHGRMLSEAAPRGDDRVLVITSGSDYLAALVRTRTPSVTVVRADEVAAGFGGDFSLVLIDGAVEVLPPVIERVLGEGGRIVTGIAERGVTRLAAGRKIAGTVTLIALADMGIPLLPEFAAPKSWSF